MSGRLLGALKSDLLFQFRSGIYWIYIVISVFYVVTINLLPKSFGAIVVPFMIFSDPSVLGFFFIGGLIMLEKGQGILDLVTVTPLRTKEYLLSKVISLNLISLIAGIAIAVFTQQTFNWVLLIMTIILTASVFTLFGFMVSVRCHTVNQYFVRVMTWMTLIIVPCFSLIGFPMSGLFYAFPSVAAAKLFIIAFNGGAIIDLILCCISMVLWLYVLMKRAIGDFEAYSIKVGV